MWISETWVIFFFVIHTALFFFVGGKLLYDYICEHPEDNVPPFDDPWTLDKKATEDFKNNGIR